MKGRFNPHGKLILPYFKKLPQAPQPSGATTLSVSSHRHQCLKQQEAGEEPEPRLGAVQLLLIPALRCLVSASAAVVTLLWRQERLALRQLRLSAMSPESVSIAVGAVSNEKASRAFAARPLRTLREAQGAGLRVAGVADWASKTLSSRRHWCRELSVCAMAAPEAFGRPGAPADSRPGPPRSKAKAGDLAGCLLRRKAFRKPPQQPEAFGRPGAPADSRPGPP
ncbi:hypothetical protein QTO34_016868 [Cnephaeus nilssonii]|uniref:Uncharacterized protein n=1 Tax=Cnephaeus nilssonii TaxID=3371016 RepID=A0AA40I317_CNENI|nr:hypothetical protein QTO34_016868 [Eptesicus nilssonii]